MSPTAPKSPPVAVTLVARVWSPNDGKLTGLERVLGDITGVVRFGVGLARLEGICGGGHEALGVTRPEHGDRVDEERTRFATKGELNLGFRLLGDVTGGVLSVAERVVVVRVGIGEDGITR